MKKQISILCIILLLLAMLPAAAKTDSGENVELCLQNTDAAGEVYITVYAQDRLQQVITATAVQDGEDSRIFVPADKLPAEYTLRVFVPSLNIAAVPEIIKTETETPAPTETPEPTTEPEDATAVYESKAAGMQAFFAVTAVSEGVDADNMEAILVDGFYQGKAVTLTLDTDSVLDTAPSAYSELAGASVANLQQGDVLALRAGLSGQLLGIDLIFRPMTDDIVATEETVNFAPMLTANGLVGGKWRLIPFGGEADDKTEYAFGVVKKRNDNTLVLTNQAGIELQDLYIPISKHTVVYTYDSAVRSSKNRMEIGARGDIAASEIPSNTKDEDLNIVRWNAEDAHTYALVRLYDGVAADVIAYLNY